MSAQQSQAARPVEIEGPTNRFLIHPLSRRLVPILAPTGIHPNLVSLAGLAFGAVAAWLYARPGSWTDAVAALACMLAWLVLDGADGQLARFTGKASATGRVVDGIADYSVFILVYVALAKVSDPAYGTLAWVMGWLAGASHIVQSALYELQREKYVSWSNAGAALPRGRTPQGEAWRQGGFWWIEWGYVRLQRLVDGRGIVIPAAGHRSAPPGSDTRRAIAAAYRGLYTSHVHRWGFLGANSHVLAIFVLVLAGWPIGYFLFEATVMNLALIMLLARKRRLDRRFTAELKALLG